MRRQDELRVLYPRLDRHNQKFILAQLDDLASTFDSDELLGFLQGQLGVPDPLLRHQAASTLTRFLPGYFQKIYQVSPTGIGLWTQYAAGVSRLSRLENLNERDPRLKEADRQKALRFLAPLAGALVLVADRAPRPLRTLSRLALAQFPLTSTLDALRATCSRFPGDVDLTLALARCGGSAGSAALEERMGAHHVREADHLLALPGLEAPGDKARDLARATSSHGRVNLALSLGKCSGEGILPAVLELLGFQEGWTDVYCAHALSVTGRRHLVSELISLHDRSSHLFVRSQVVRAIGRLGGEEAIEFCLGRLKDPADSMRAQALESLIRARLEAGPLREAARPLVESPHLRSRVNALLAVLDRDEAVGHPRVREMLLSSNPLERLEGAYCLGYWPTRRSLLLLRTLACREPNVHVAAQAVKSLSRYPAHFAVPTLIGILEERPDEVGRTVARILTRYDGEDGAHVCEAIRVVLEGDEALPVRPLLLKTLGRVGAHSGYLKARDTLVAALEHDDPAHVRGALEGLKILSALTPLDVDPVLEKLESRGGPRLRPQVRLLRILQGHLPSQDDLLVALKGRSLEEAGATVEVAMELGILATYIVCEGRHPTWLEALDSKPAAPEETAQDPRVLENWSLPPSTTSEVEIRPIEVDPLPPQPEEPGGHDAPDQPVHEEVGELISHLNDQKARPPPDDIGDEIGGNTYAVEDAFTRAVFGQEWLTRARIQFDALVDVVRENKILLVPQAIIIVTFLYNLHLARSPVGPGRPAVAARVTVLSVLSAQGRVTDGADNPLRSGKTLSIGQKVRTGEGGSVVLLTPGGDRIEQGPESILTIENRGEDGALHVAVEEGRFNFRFTHRACYIRHIESYVGVHGSCTVSGVLHAMRVTARGGRVAYRIGDTPQKFLEVGASTPISP